MKNTIVSLVAFPLVLLGSVLSAPGPARAYEEIPVTDGGAISGVVRWTGPPPRLETFPVNRDETVCDPEKTGVRPTPRLVLGPGGGVANAVVYLADIARGKPLPARGLGDPLRLTIRRCEFEPHVQVAPVRSYLAMLNRDPVLHNIRMFGAADYNLPMPEKGTLFVKPLSAPGVIRIRNDAGHGWMSAWIHVAAHPYYAVTDHSGRFRLPDVPPGDYTLMVWHEGWRIRRTIERRGLAAFYEFDDPALLSRKLTLPPNGALEVEFALPAKP